MRKSHETLEEIKIIKTLSKKDIKLHTSGHKTAFIYPNGGNWFL